MSWDVEIDEPSCTLEEAFKKVNSRLGFNIELKFDDYIVYEQDYLVHVLQTILQVYNTCLSFSISLIKNRKFIQGR